MWWILFIVACNHNIFKSNLRRFSINVSQVKTNRHRSSHFSLCRAATKWDQEFPSCQWLKLDFLLVRLINVVYIAVVLCQYCCKCIFRILSTSKMELFVNLVHIWQLTEFWIYFLIRFAQTKITIFIFVNNWVIRKNESFLQVEPFSRE